jgi:hypothetical protein
MRAQGMQMHTGSALMDSSVRRNDVRVSSAHAAHNSQLSTKFRNLPSAASHCAETSSR